MPFDPSSAKPEAAGGGKFDPGSAQLNAPEQDSSEDTTETEHWYSPFVEFGKGAAQTFTGLETAARNLTGTKNLADPNSPWNLDEQMRRWANTQPTNQDWPEWLARTAGQATTGAVLAAPIGGVPGMFVGGALTGAGLNPEHPLEAGGISGLISTAVGWPLSRLAAGAATRAGITARNEATQAAHAADVAEHETRMEHYQDVELPEHEARVAEYMQRGAERAAPRDYGPANTEIYQHILEPLGQEKNAPTQAGHAALRDMQKRIVNRLNQANSHLTLSSDDALLSGLQREGDRIGTTLSNSPQEIHWRDIMNEQVLQPLARNPNRTGREINEYIGNLNNVAAKLGKDAARAPYREQANLLRMRDALNNIANVMEKRITGPEAAKMLRANARESYLRLHDLIRSVPADQAGIAKPSQMLRAIARREGGSERFYQNWTPRKQRLTELVQELEGPRAKVGRAPVKPKAPKAPKPPKLEEMPHSHLGESLLRGAGHLAAHAALPYPANFFFYPTIHQLARQAARQAPRIGRVPAPSPTAQAAATLAGQALQSPDQSDEEQ